MQAELLVVLGAYLIGSIPSALIVSRLLGRGDVRRLGDGNMGARNVARQIGWGAGAAVAVLDFGKGVLSVWAARKAGLPEMWQLAAGLAAVFGHDFPIWAGFVGGQGMATSLGVLSFLIPLPTVIGMVAFGLGYLVTRAFDLSAGLALGLIVVVAWQLGAPIVWVVYTAALFASIGLKKALDRPRREALRRRVEPSSYGETPSERTESRGRSRGRQSQPGPRDGAKARE